MGPGYTYAYDDASRPVSLTDNQSTPVAWVNNVQYGLSGELLQMTYAGITETRTYNSRLQLTRIGSLEYRYSPTQNNGQITQQKDWSSGEEVTYAYDSLQRLISAVTTDSPTVPQWGQSFTYDGFGNRTSATVTKGSAPFGNWSYDPATNRGGGGFDANGNMTSGANLTGLVYDVENRLVSVPTYNQNGAGSEQYAYDPANKRIYKRTMDGTEELYFYGISGQKLGTYRPWVYQYGVSILTVDTNLYFGSRMIVSRGVVVTLDRLGSNRTGGSRYFPYGEEQQVTAQDRDKFATYYRDGTTALDYAQNRYYASTLGRFTNPDPYTASVGPADPGSWNRYSYTRGDPVNRYDPEGQADCAPGDTLPCTVSVFGSGPSAGGGGGPSGPSPGPARLDPPPLTGPQRVAVINNLREAVKLRSETDCEALADYIDAVAGPLEGSKTGSQQLKVALAALTPNQFPVYLIPGVGSNSNYIALNPGNRASGFASQFRDQDPNADQAHHFAAFFQLGFVYGASVGASAASWWEKMEWTPGNAGDINLGTTAALMGAYVASGVLPVEQVGATIRDNLCKR